MDNKSKIQAMLAAASNSLLARVLEDTLNKKELDVIFPWLGAEIRENRVDVFAIYDTMSDEELDTALKGTWPYVVKELRAS